jgi:hypothetical protein
MSFKISIPNPINLIKHGAEGVAKVATGAVHAVGTVGSEVKKGATAAGNSLGDGIGVAWDYSQDQSARLVDAGRSLATGALDVSTGLFVGVGEGLRDFSAGVCNIVLGGNVGSGVKDMGVGLFDATVRNVVDESIIAGTRAISAVQTVTHLEEVGRSLNDGELAELRKVFGNTIDYSKVRIKEGDAGIFDLNDRPFTPGNTIYMKMDASNPAWTQTLVHEMSHVWQYQNGNANYLSGSLLAQATQGETAAYRWADGAAEGKSWSQLGPEQQATLVEAAYVQGFFDDPAHAPVVFEGRDLTDYVRAAVDQMRAGVGAP